LKYELVKSTNFIRAAVKLAKRNPNFLIELNDVLTMLTENPFNVKLKTHKLKGELN
jgi:mRNA-degrading endonuclease YafQ of YafQ-DinJ toxin-antitoxin module